MARSVILSLTAQEQRLQILSYWEDRTGSIAFSKKLDDGLETVFDLISKFPNIGKKIENRSDRCFVFRKYQIVYALQEDIIAILRIWDSRQDPGELDI